MEEKKKKIAFEAYICIVLLVIMTVVMTMEVGSRYIFNNSLVWAEELSRYLFIWFIFISASFAVAESAHIKTDVLINVLPKIVRPYVPIIGTIIWLVFSIFAVYLGINYVLSMGTNSTSAALGLPLWIVYLGVPVGYGLMSIRIVIDIIKQIKGFRTNAKEV